MTPANSLLSRARHYLQNRAGRTALTVAPLAALGMAAASSARADTAVFDPGATFAYGPDSNDIFFYNASGGGLEGSSLGTNSAGVTGATFDSNIFSGAGITFQDFEGGFAGTVGSIQIFSINGVGSGSLNPVNASAQINYDFTLTTYQGFTSLTPAGSGKKPSAVVANPFGPTVTGGTLALTVTTNAGVFSQNVALDASGVYLGTAGIPVNGTTLESYSAVLTVNYAIGVDGDGNDASITATVPAGGSIDFTAVPEPSTWLILATGVAGAGFQVMRVRQRSAKAAPTVA